MNPVAITMIVVLVIYCAVGLFTARKIHNGDSFYVMEEKAPTLFLVCGICMAYISAVTMSSGPGFCYEQGPVVLLTSAQPGAWLGVIVAILFIGRKMKSIGCYTMPDYFIKRFADSNVTFLAVLIMAVGLMIYGIGQLMAIGNVLSDVTGLSYEWLIVIFTVAIMMLCVPGGTWGIMLTDILMFAVVFIAMAVVCPIVMQDIAPEALANLPAEFWSRGGLNNHPVGYNISQFFLWFMFFAGSPVIITRVFPAKSDFALVKACVISVVLIAIMATLTYLTAGMMRGVEPGIVPSDKVMLQAFLNHAPTVLGLIGIMAILTASMSTAAIVFELAGFAISRDLYGVLNPNKPQGDSVRRARLAQVVVIALCGLVAYLQPMSNFDISVFVCSIFASSWLPVIVLSLLWKRFNASGAFYGMLVGISTLLILQALVSFKGLVLPASFDQHVIGIILSVIVSVVVSILRPAGSGNAVNHYRIQNTLPSDMIITESRRSPNALSTLLRRYRTARRVIMVTLLISVVFWLVMALYFP